jgi:hypothetical protein
LHYYANDIIMAKNIWLSNIFAFVAWLVCSEVLASVATVNSPKKCCPDGHVLRRSGSGSNLRLECLNVGFVASSVSYLPEVVLERQGNSTPLTVSSPWREDGRSARVGLPENCHHYNQAGVFMAKEFSNRSSTRTTPSFPLGDGFMLLYRPDDFKYMLTTDMELVSVLGDFETLLDMGDFCLDRMLKEEKGTPKFNARYHSLSATEPRPWLRRRAAAKPRRTTSATPTPS